jgi:hypothetical protein
VPPLVSGNRVDFNVYILDQDGNVYTSDSKSKASLDSKSTDTGSSLSEEDDDGLGDLPVTTNSPEGASSSQSSPQLTDVILLNNTVTA